MQDVPITLANACRGAVENRFHELTALGLEHLNRDDLVSGTERFDMTFTISMIGTPADGMKIVLTKAEAKASPRKAPGSLVRVHSGVILVDVEEDADGNQPLPFPKSNTP